MQIFCKYSALTLNERLICDGFVSLSSLTVTTSSPSALSSSSTFFSSPTTLFSSPATLFSSPAPRRNCSSFCLTDSRELSTGLNNIHIGNLCYFNTVYCISIIRASIVIYLISFIIVFYSFRELSKKNLHSQ